MVGQDIEKLIVSLEANIKSYENQMRKAAGVTTAEMKKIKAESAGASKVLDQMAPAVRRFGDAAASAGNNVVAFRSRVGQVATQIGDFAVQVGAGTSATQALAQQLPQLLGVFGALGAILGAGAAIGIPLISAAMRAAGDESVTLDERLASLNEAMEAAQAASADLGLSQTELAAKFAGTAEQVAALQGSLAQRAIEDLAAQIAAAGHAFDPFRESIERTKLEFQALGLEFSQGNAIEALAASFKLSIDQVIALVDQMNAFNAAVSDDERNSVIQATLALLERMRAELGELPPKAEEFRQSMLDVAPAVSEATAAVTALRGETTAAAVQAEKTASAYRQLADAVALAHRQEKARLDALTGPMAATEDPRSGRARGLYLTHAERSALTVSQGGFRADPVPKAAGGGGGSSRESEVEAEERKLTAVKTRAWRDYYREIERMRKQEQQEIFEANNFVADSFTDLFTGAISGAKSLQDSLGGLVEELGKLLINKGFMAILEGTSWGASAGGTFLSGLISKRASGGPVTAGHPYIVGERGHPELFVPSQAGMIIPAIPKMAGGGAQGGVVDVRLSVDQGGNWAAAVEKISGRVSVQVTQAGMKQVRAEVPGLALNHGRRKI